MPRESMKAKRERALEVCERIGEHYPDAQPALDFGGEVIGVHALDHGDLTDDAPDLIGLQMTDEMLGTLPLKGGIFFRQLTLSVLTDKGEAEIFDGEEDLLRWNGFGRGKESDMIGDADTGSAPGKGSIHTRPHGGKGIGDLCDFFLSHKR